MPIVDKHFWNGLDASYGKRNDKSAGKGISHKKGEAGASNAIGNGFGNASVSVLVYHGQGNQIVNVAIVQLYSHVPIVILNHTHLLSGIHNAFAYHNVAKAFAWFTLLGVLRYYNR